MHIIWYCLYLLR